MDRRIGLTLDMLRSGEMTFDEALETIRSMRPQVAALPQNTPRRDNLSKKIKIKVEYFDEESGRMKSIRLPGIGLRFSKYIMAALMFIARKAMMRCDDGETWGHLGRCMRAIKRSQLQKTGSISGAGSKAEEDGDYEGSYLCEMKGSMGEIDACHMAEGLDECDTCDAEDGAAESNIGADSKPFAGKRAVDGKSKESTQDIYEATKQVIFEGIKHLRRCEPLKLVSLESDDAKVEIYTY